MCPVYERVGGHAYGSVYPGPIGAILTPQLEGIENAPTLPSAAQPVWRVLQGLPGQCVVEAGQVVAGVPEAITALAPATRAGAPLTLVSGPSDVGHRAERVEGVHGPRVLDVVIVV